MIDIDGQIGTEVTGALQSLLAPIDGAHFESETEMGLRVLPAVIFKLAR